MNWTFYDWINNDVRPVHIRIRAGYKRGDMRDLTNHQGEYWLVSWEIDDREDMLTSQLTFDILERQNGKRNFDPNDLGSSLDMGMYVVFEWDFGEGTPDWAIGWEGYIDDVRSGGENVTTIICRSSADIPADVLVGIVRRALVHHRRGGVHQRPVDDVRVAGDPADVGRAEVDV